MLKKADSHHGKKAPRADLLLNIKNGEKQYMKEMITLVKNAVKKAEI